MDLKMFTGLGDSDGSFPRALSEALDRINGQLLCFENTAIAIGYEAMFEHFSAWVTIVERQPEAPSWILGEPKPTPLGSVASIVFILMRGPTVGYAISVQSALAVGRPLTQPGPVQLALTEQDVLTHPHFRDADELAAILEHSTRPATG